MCKKCTLVIQINQSDFDKLLEQTSKKKMTQLFQKTKTELFKRPLLYILCASILIRVFHLMFNQPLWWDSHVYIGMGKYMFSDGAIGIWEVFRPLVHPFILGAFWKINFDPVIIGKILDVLFSIISVYLVYLIAHKVFNKRIALVSAFLFSFSPVFLMFTGLILTEPLALFFGLLGVYLFIRKDTGIHLLFSGIFCGLAFLTKFPQGIYFAAIGLVIIFRKEKLFKKIKSAFIIGFGFAMTTLPFFIFNYNRYGDFLFPLTSASWIVTTATWIYGTGISFYLINYFMLNPINLFFFSYIYRFFKEKEWRNYSKLLLFLIPTIIILYFMFIVPRKEIRYMITAVPFLAILIGATLVRVHQKLLKMKEPWIRPQAFIIICVLLVFSFVPSAIFFEKVPTFNKEINQIIDDKGITGKVLASDPSFISYLDNPLVLLSGMDFAPEIYDQQRDKYELLFVNDCDLLCAPDDAVCWEERKTLFQDMATENEEILKTSHKFKKHTCTYIIYIPKK
jgi:hypothetical protein